MNRTLLRLWESQHSQRLICYVTSVKPVNNIWSGQIFVINEQGQDINLSTTAFSEKDLYEKLAYAVICSNFII